MKARAIPLVLTLLLLAGCVQEGQSQRRPAPEEPAPAASTPPAVAPEPLDGGVTVCDPPADQPCRIIDGAEDGTLLLAALPGGAFDGHVFRLTVDEETELWMDGEPITVGQLEDGMRIDVAFDGSVSRSFPFQFGGVRYLQAYSRGTAENPGGTLYDLCGFYLQVLDDLWQVDPGLNADISTAIVDLSAAPGMDSLTDAEQRALLWRFGELHSVTALDVSDPSAQALLDDAGYGSDCGTELRGLTDACLFTIRPHETETEEIYSLPTLRFDAEKWGGPLAAYIFYDCTAVWAEFGTWSGYQVGAEAIA